MNTVQLSNYVIHVRARVWTLLDFESVRFPDNTQHRQILILIYMFLCSILELHWMHAFLIIPNIHVYVNDTDHVGLVEYGLVSDSNNKMEKGWHKLLDSTVYV